MPWSLLIFLLSTALLPAQEKEEAKVPVQVRVVLHDPLKPVAGLFYLDKNGQMQRILFKPKSLSDAMEMVSTSGSLFFYDRQEVDPEQPKAHLAAVITHSPEARQLMLVVLPSAKDEALPYQAIVIDESPKEFPQGEAKVISLLNRETAVQAGEHRIRLPSGKVTRIPPVTKVSEFHMAQTNFYYEFKGSWIPFTERQLQYTDAYRRLFIIHATPGAMAPRVSTIVDIAPVGKRGD